MFNVDDYMTVEEIAKEFGMSRNGVRRWIGKYAANDAVEVYGGKYYVHKEEVHRWRAAYEGKRPMKGRKVPFGRKHPELGESNYEKIR